MEILFDTANYLQIFIITFATVGVIALARKAEIATLPGILIIVNLGLLLYHSFVLNSVAQSLTEQISHLYLCLAMDFLWLLLSFLGYLWIDDIAAIKFHKKNYDNSFAWFWDKL